MHKSSGQEVSKPELGNLNDKQLAEYLHAINLKWIKAVMEVSLTKKGTKQFRDAFILQRACESVYGQAVTAAKARGMLIFH